MKAVMQDGYCGPEELRLEEVPKPEIADDDVLVQVKAAP
jgi:NADPH:quinone reductase-like Zn-dependent oxidoreductase